MLYRYASPDYLKDVSSIITQLIDGNLTPELERQVAASYAHVMQGQQRVHNDSQLWADNSRSLLAQMQSLLAQDIRQRSGGAYRSGSLDDFFTQVARSDAGEAYRMSDEYHVYSNLIGQYISAADDILVEHRRRQGICDFWFACRYADFLSDQEFIPRFRVRTDIVAASGEVPPRAGVYISIDDPNAALQFAWPDNDRGMLTDCCTFNEIGLAALADVGRDALWFDQNKMADFFQSNGLKTPFGEQFPVSYSTIPGSVQIESKARRPCQWHFVEIEEENFEYTAMELHRDLVSQPGQGRLAAGDACENLKKWWRS